jgi:quercetin dioxygenase-like cupin family protein
MMNVRPFQFGNIAGSVYDFEEPGDVLPMHVHDETNVHMTVVARGSFKAHGNGWERELACGSVVDWEAHDPHEFIALEPNSRLVNIQKK